MLEGDVHVHGKVGKEWRMGIDSWELARLCGVSRGTVDRALHGRLEVGAKTREKVLRVAAAHGYTPNLVGRALSTGRTMSIGVIAFDLDNSFFTEVVSAIERAARGGGYMTLLALSRKDPEAERQCLDYFIQKKVDGLIVVPVGKARAVGERLSSSGIPVVTFGNRLGKACAHVGIDECGAAADAVACLAGKGYSRIIYFCPPMRHKGRMNLYGQERRHDGFREAVATLGIPHEVIIDEQVMWQRMTGGFRGETRTAVLCSNDIYAIEALRRAEAAGLSVPRDFGLMGYDNLSILSYVKPRLATVAYPTAATGEGAVELLMRLLKGEAAGDLLVPHTIVEGETV